MLVCSATCHVCSLFLCELFQIVSSILKRTLKHRDDVEDGEVDIGGFSETAIDKPPPFKIMKKSSAHKSLSAKAEGGGECQAVSIESLYIDKAIDADLPAEIFSQVSVYIVKQIRVRHKRGFVFSAKKCCDLSRKP